MTDRELERRLERALSHGAPDDVDGVLSRCETRKGAVIPVKKKMTTRSLIAACLTLALVGGGGGLYYQQASAVASVVSLDVNPSIELKVNRGEKVLSCAALNKEAKEALAEMGGGTDLEGTKLDVAVNAIVGALVRHGYLDGISSAILISVEDKDQDRAVKLEQELAAAVDGVLQKQSANAAVLSQTLTQDTGLEEQARENNISTGKAYLVRQVMEMNGSIAKNSDTDLKELSALSVEELNDLLEGQIKKIPIGKLGAEIAVMEYTRTMEMDSVTAEADPELDESPAHYEVELCTEFGEFEYQVDAFTGEVLTGQRNIWKGNQPILTEAEALAQAEVVAKNQYHREMAGHDTTDHHIELRDDGQYHVEFTCNGYKFNCRLDAYTGRETDWDIEGPEGGKSGGQLTLGVAVPYISLREAEDAALRHAGLERAQVITALRSERDRDHGHVLYEVEFQCDGVEYEYEIDALDGAVWTHERERDDDHD